MNFEVGDRLIDPKFEVENTSLFASLHDTQVNISNDNPRATFATISYHIPHTPDFLNMNGTINYVVSDWTPWKNQTLGNADGELSIGEIFPSKFYFQHVVKMYPIKSLQEFNVYISNTNVLVL